MAVIKRSGCNHRDREYTRRSTASIRAVCERLARNWERRATIEPQRRVAVLERALVGAGFVVLFAVLPHSLIGDDAQRFSDIQGLLHHGALSDGRYSLVMPILSAPFLLVGSVVGSPEWWAARFNVIAVGVGLMIAWRLVRGRIDPTSYRRFVLVLLFASYATNRLRDYNAEVLTATLVGLGIICLVSGRHLTGGWAAIVLGVVNTPGAMLGLVGLAVAEAARTRRLRHLLPIVVAGILIMGEAWVRRGSPLSTGYEGDHGVRTLLPYSGRPGFSYPIVLGILSILFSFGRGLVFFAPGLLLWLRRETRRLAKPCRQDITFMLLFLGGLVLLYAKWWAWYGGISWGPRFFLFAALPASLILALCQRAAGRSAVGDAITLGVLAASAWVSISGALENPAALSICARNAYAYESFCWYLPEFSSLLHPLADARGASHAALAAAAYCLVVFVYLASPLVLAPARALGSSLAGARRGDWRF